MTQLGKYELFDELGKGGFGTVYKARDTVLDVERAVKVLHPALLSDTTFVSRFQQEAQLAARLEHAHLVPVYDFGEEDGRIYLAMKYLPGGSLADRLKESGPLDQASAMHIFQQAAEGLNFAHSRGIVHRDLKPSNILFDEDGNVRISDLGFAKSMDGGTKSSISTSGMMVGTPAYMAPELWRGKAASPASDIYSMGCILYEMLTGEVLFGGDSPADVMTKHVLDGPVYDGSVPEKILPLIKKALSREPAERFVNMKEFVEALHEVCIERQPVQAAVEKVEEPSKEEVVSEVKKPESSIQTKAKRSTRKHDTDEKKKINSVSTESGKIIKKSERKNPGSPAYLEKSKEKTENPNNFFVRYKKLNKWILLGAGVGLVLLLFLEIGSINGWFMSKNRAIIAYEPSVGAVNQSSMDNMIMVYIPAGDFLMGSKWNVGSPQHTVYLSGYWIDWTEITNGMYKHCVAMGGCTAPSSTESNQQISYYTDPEFSDYPVINVSWDQANEYCEWAGRKLPTEAQWEKAARGTDGNIYPWGDEAPNASLANINMYVGDPTKVGSYPEGSSPYGVLDMAGNISEWTADWYGRFYYWRIGRWEDPQGPASGTYRVYRDGSWQYYHLNFGSAFRDGFPPLYSDNNIGFRCSLSSNEIP